MLEFDDFEGEIYLQAVYLFINRVCKPHVDVHDRFPITHFPITIRVLFVLIQPPAQCIESSLVVLLINPIIRYGN